MLPVRKSREAPLELPSIPDNPEITQNTYKGCFAFVGLLWILSACSLKLRCAESLGVKTFTPFDSQHLESKPKYPTRGYFE